MTHTQLSAFCNRLLRPHEAPLAIQLFMCLVLRAPTLTYMASNRTGYITLVINWEPSR